MKPLKSALNDGDRIYAFGHPFSSDGTIELPMAKAWIHTVISSLQRSFKLSSSGETVGAFTYDFSKAIYGHKGAAPDMVPVKASLLNEDTGLSPEPAACDTGPESGVKCLGPRG